jgi:hypothetical protein
MALDSTPSDLSSSDDQDWPDGPSAHWSDRRVLTVAIVLGAVVLALLSTGVVDAAAHAVAHAFPGLMLGGCGGG